MLKKEEVYVVLEKNKHHDKFSKIINMFNVDCTVDIRGIAVFDSSFFPDTQNKTRVSLKELRNILAREKQPVESVIDKAISLLQHGLGLDYSHEVIQGLEELKNK